MGGPKIESTIFHFTIFLFIIFFNDKLNLDRMDFCCGLGNKTDENDRSCLRRTGDLDVDIFEEQKLIDDCKLTFFRCCVHKFGKQGTVFLRSYHS